MQSLAKGALVANRHAEVASRTGAVMVIEGERGYGQVVGYEAMELAMQHAAEFGVALLAIRNSFHLGRIGHWAEQCAAGGFASIHFVNGVDHGPIQAPFGSAQSRLSTNPFAAALPGADGPIIMLDMATSKIAFGKARVAFNKGVPVPDGCLITANGMPTCDPAVMFQEPQGALVSMGDHKGSGLAILCELLAGALTGGRTIQPEHPMVGGTVNNMLSVIIDPEAVGGRAQSCAGRRRPARLHQGREAAARLRRDPGAGRARAATAEPASGRRHRGRRAQLGRHHWRRRGPRGSRTPRSTRCSPRSGQSQSRIEAWNGSTAW